MGARPRLTQHRRLQALEAAREVIAERGLADTRIADVAERAGLSAALLLYYFKSKDNLLTDALAFAEDRFYLETFHELAAVDGAKDRLVRLIELACPRDTSRSETGDWRLWLELWSRALRDPEAARKREALDRRWRTTIADIVRIGQRRGEFVGDQDPNEFAVRLAALIDGLALQVVLRDPEVTVETMRNLCLDMAQRELSFDALVRDRIS
ncbi:TetR/AcrR family transcriptional regulator [soil metagenome]